MIIDTHIHYTAPLAEQPLTQDAPAIAPLTVDELCAAASQAGIDRVVQVTPSMMGFDNRYSFEGALARPDRVLGVFGRFDPQAPRLQARLRAYWRMPMALGIRQTMFGQQSRRWLTDRTLDPFLRAAAALDVPVALFAPFQARETLDTARRHPAVRFIVDHTLIRHEPGQRLEDAYRHWRDLLQLAACPNVWTKVSHFPEAALGEEAYPYPTAQRHFRQLFERVGPDRLVWGSNYPPVLRACPYRRTLDFFTDACGFLSPQDRRAILGETFLRHFARHPASGRSHDTSIQQETTPCKQQTAPTRT